MATTKRMLSVESLEKVILDLCDVFKIVNLHQTQFDALHNFICGRDVFVSKPTRSGKSIIFQMAPFVEMALSKQDRAWRRKAILIVICPLVSLMKDQVKYLESLGLSAAYVSSDQSEAVLKNIETGHYNLVYMSPESTLVNDRWRSMISNEVYSKALMGIAVDEVHCVTHWGLCNGNRERAAFRKWYSRLNELRSLVKEGLPIIALTATSTKTTQKKIFRLLELKTPFMVVDSPERNIISYAVQEIDKSTNIFEYFICIVNEVRKKGKESMRTIIYCQSINQCSSLFNFMSEELGDNLYNNFIDNPKERIVEMMHSQTPSRVKEHILDQFSKADGHLRILIATIAYGMGVNCKGVRRVIHYGPSKSIEAYIQESGRCGRQGDESYAVLLYNSVTMRAADEGMKGYIENNKSCRREVLLQHFDGKSDEKRPKGHQCCDICAELCRCQKGYYCDMDLHLPVLVDEGDDESNGNLVRTVTDSQKQQLKIKLVELQKQLIISDASSSTKHVSYPTTLMHFGEIQIGQVLQHCHKIFTSQDVAKYVELWNNKHAHMIMGIIQDIFGDVNYNVEDSDSSTSDSEETENCETEMNTCTTNKSFLSLLSQSQETESFSVEAEDTYVQSEAMFPNIVNEVIHSCMETDE